MAIFNTYASKSLPADDDTVLIYDSETGKNKQMKYSDLAKAIIEQFSNDIEIVENYSGLLTSTADKVLVLHDNSRYGSGKQCFYEVQGTATQKGYERNDHTVVFPMADQGPLVSSTPPIQYLMSVLRTWVGNVNVAHVPSGQSDYHGLFAMLCRRTLTINGQWIVQLLFALCFWELSTKNPGMSLALRLITSQAAYSEEI